MDLGDFYRENSGLAVVKYEDGSSYIDRITDLPDDTYIGISQDKDFSTNVEGYKIKSVSIYRIANLKKVEL